MGKLREGWEMKGRGGGQTRRGSVMKGKVGVGGQTRRGRVMGGRGKGKILKGG